jgi:hypothetical protein
MIPAVRCSRFVTSTSILVFALAGCSSTAEDAQAIGVEHPRGTLAGHPCSRDPGGCPTDAGDASDAGPDAPTEAEAEPAPAYGGDAMASTDAEEEVASADFTWCRFDSDCLAVPKVGCCRLGFQVAVNRDQMQAYEASFTCGESRPICPMYIVVDRRVAECDNATRRCTLISVDHIACGGFIRNQHACPRGYFCDVHGRPPDIPGVCVAETDD